MQASSTMGWKNCELEIWKYPPVLPHFFWWTFPLFPLCSSRSSLPSRQHQKLPFSVNFFALSTFLPSQLFLFSFFLSYMPSVYMYYFCLLPRTYMFWHIWFVFHHFIGLAHFTCRNLNHLPNLLLKSLIFWSLVKIRPSTSAQENLKVWLTHQLTGVSDLCFVFVSTNGTLNGGGISVQGAMDHGAVIWAVNLKKRTNANFRP